MEIVMALCGLGKEALLALEQEKKTPAEIHYKKSEGVDADIEVSIMGPGAQIYAGLCELTCRSLEHMQPGDKAAQKADKAAQKAVLDMIHDDAVRVLGLEQERKTFGPINPDDVEW